MITAGLIYSQDATFTVSTQDTIINTGSVTADLQVRGTYSTGAFQVHSRKISGTHGGTVILQGSLDGTSFYTFSSDTLTITSDSLVTRIWIVDKPPYKYYRFKATGTGTMRAILTAWAHFKKK